MPDWTYHPLLRPVGIALHGEKTRSVTLRRLRAIASIAPGRWFIRFVGHTELDESLAVKKGGFEFGGPVMLTAAIDPNGTAHKALSQFAFGAIELAPGTPTSFTNAAKVVERFSAGVAPATATSYLRCSIDEIDAAGAFGLPLLVDERVVIEGDDPAVILERTRTLRQELGGRRTDCRRWLCRRAFASNRTSTSGR